MVIYRTPPAVTVLMALGSMARRDPTGPGLLPCRIHTFFRGLPGLWVYTDPDCSEVPADQRGGICGRMYGQPHVRCDCGARVLELYTCRYCGTAYARAYSDDVENPSALWSEAGQHDVEMAVAGLRCDLPADVLTRLVDEPCPCGLFARRIARIRGRSDEMVVCGMGNVGPWVFETILRGVDGCGDDWQVVVRHEGSRDLVELHLEMDDASCRAAVEDAIHTNLRERFADFWKNREMSLYDLRVEAHRPGSLRGSGRKLRRVVDER